jgi:hypothetical protein
MKKFKIKRLPTQQNVYLKNRIVKTRGRARAVGIVYAVSTLVLIVAACFPLLETEQTGLGGYAKSYAFTYNDSGAWKDQLTKVTYTDYNGTVKGGKHSPRH